MKRSLIIVVLVVLSIAVVGTAGWVFFGSSWLADRQAAAEADTLRSDPRTAEMFANIEQRQREIEQTPDNAELYLSIANNWKAIFDARGEVRFLDRAIEWYEKGIGVTQRKNSLYLMNLANAYRLRKQPDLAERILREAIEVNPGDPMLYTTLVDVLRYDLKRDSKDIIDVYKNGLETLVDNGPLVQSLASYLEDIGRYKDALTYYELLAAKYPGFEDKITSLKSKIESQP